MISKMRKVGNLYFVLNATVKRIRLLWDAQSGFPQRPMPKEKKQFNYEFLWPCCNLK